MMTWRLRHSYQYSARTIKTATGLDWRDLQPFGGRRCERGSAATRDCKRLVEARGGACFFIRVHVRCDGPRSALMGAARKDAVQ